MNSKAPRSRSDDIVQLKDRLGLEDLPYQDLTRVIELGRACRRWPLLGETVAQLGVTPPATIQSGQALPDLSAPYYPHPGESPL